MSASQYQYERGLLCILYHTCNMIVSSMYTWFWCPNLTFSIYTIQINIVGCYILLDAKKNIPNAFIELLGMNQNKRSMDLLQLVSFQKTTSKICFFGGYKTSSVAHEKSFSNCVNVVFDCWEGCKTSVFSNTWDFSLFD